MSEVIDNLIVDWEKLLFGFGLLVLGFLTFMFNQYRKAQKKKSEEKKKDDIQEEIEIIAEKANINNPEEKKESFIDLFMDNTYIIKLICQLKDELMCDRITVLVTVNLELGIKPKDIDENKYDQIFITHECRNNKVASEKELHEVVKVHHMMPAIIGIEDGRGMLIVNTIEDIDEANTDLLGLFKYAGAPKSVCDSGIYRPEVGQRRKYIIGGLVCAYVFNEHTFTREDISRMATVRDQIGAIIGMMYDDYVKNQ